MKILMAVFSVCLILSFFAGDVFASVYVKEYEAKFEPVSGKEGGPSDVRVQLKIVFGVSGQKLEKGFKFVGNLPISNVSVEDESGPISFRVEKMREQKISFKFDPISSGEKTVYIGFVVHDAVKQGIFDANFSAAWFGNWKIQVKKARFIFVFPPGYRYNKLITNLPSYKEEPIDGKSALVFEQAPLVLRQVELLFSPGFQTAHLLPFYALCLIIALYLAGYAIIRIRKVKASVLVDGREPSPAEIAYIKKGRRHALCVSLFDLIRRGVLEMKPSRSLKSNKKDDGLQSYEIVLVGFFRSDKTLSELLKDRGVLKNYDLGIVNSLSRKGCLNDAEEERSVGTGLIRNSLFSLVLLLAFTFNPNIFIKGNAFFYAAVSVSIIALIAGMVLTRAHIHSRRGKEFLKRYEAKIKTSSDYVSDRNSQDPSLSYAVAVLGFAILAGSVFDEFLNYVSYTRSRFPDSSSGCSSCSSGSSGGGDGGGSSGCGGCGGGD